MPEHLSIQREGSQRLRRDSRLRNPKDFRRVQRTGRRRVGRHFVLVRGKSLEPFETRLGLAVSRKVGNAVARNHIKRRVRDWFRRNRSALPEGDLVVIARFGSAERSAEEIASELTELAR
ncbi:MAG: ribonuclease P protein component [bacterium]|nr:ribonuclease P protein component [bacterium]MCP5070789.1 ribonuclease P protein component [bacterium]